MLNHLWFPQDVALRHAIATMRACSSSRCLKRSLATARAQGRSNDLDMRARSPCGSMFTISQERARELFLNIRSAKPS
eukprot:7098618-Pyramimonas_sp.AAC.1